MTFEKVGEDLPELWEPKEGDSITGVYKAVQHNVGKNKSNMYTIEVDGELKNFWGSTVLDGKMLSVKVEDTIRVTYEGKNESPEYKKYTIEVDKPEEENAEESETPEPAEDTAEDGAAEEAEDSEDEEATPAEEE